MELFLRWVVWSMGLLLFFFCLEMYWSSVFRTCYDDCVYWFVFNDATFNRIEHFPSLKKNTDRTIFEGKNDWLIDWIEIYAEPAIFQPCNGGGRNVVMERLNNLGNKDIWEKHLKNLFKHYKSFLRCSCSVNITLFQFCLIFRVVDYITNGVRYVFRGDHGAGIINTFSQDLEPESVTISNDDRFAFISCQVFIRVKNIFYFKCEQGKSISLFENVDVHVHSYKTS